MTVRGFIGSGRIGIFDSSLPALSSTATYNGITWTFDAQYLVGYSATGRPFVVDPGGGVTINSVSPSPTGSGSSFRNGSMLNPDPTNNSIQGYDGRQIYDAGLTQAYPVTIEAGDTLVSAKSLATVGAGTGVYGDTPQVAILDAVGCLHCVSVIPGATAFAPGYAGSGNEIIPLTEMDLSFLPSLALPGNEPDIDTHTTAFGRVWLDHVEGWTSRYIHPINAMPEYGRDLTVQVGNALLLLCGEQSEAVKRALAIGLCQVGIDHYQNVVRNPTVQYASDGGHMTGRKALIIFAAKALGKLATWDLTFLAQDDDQTYHGVDIDPDETLWTGWATSGHAYQSNVLWRYSSIGAAYRHEGTPLSGWNDSPYPQFGNPDNYPWDKWEGYRRLVAPALVGQVMAMRIMGLKTAWDHDALFDYVDRWMNESDGPNRTAMAAQAVTDSWNTLNTASDWTNAAVYSPFGQAAYEAFHGSMYSNYRGSY